jgi:hypothetical protein
VPAFNIIEGTMSLISGTAGTLIDLTATGSGRTLSACCDQF